MCRKKIHLNDLRVLKHTLKAMSTENKVKCWHQSQQCDQNAVRKRFCEHKM